MEDPMTEAQHVRFGPHYENTATRWSTLESMGYTPVGVLKMVQNFWCLVEGRRKLVETNTRLTEENRVLRERLNAKG